MRGNLKRRYIYEDFLGQSSPVSSEKIKNQENWKLKLTVSQLILVWLVCLTTILVAFITGLYVGRGQGIKHALNDQGREAIRMPVARTVVSSESSQDSKIDNISITKGLEAGFGKAAIASNLEQKQELKYDFSANTNNLPSESNQQLNSSSSTVNLKQVTGGSSEESLTPGREKSGSLSRGTLNEQVTAPKRAFFVQLGIKKSAEEADLLVKRVDKSQFPVKIQEVDINRGTYFRILIGPYSSKTIAEDQVIRLSQLPNLPSKPFIRESEQ